MRAVLPVYSVPITTSRMALRRRLVEHGLDRALRGLDAVLERDLLDPDRVHRVRHHRGRLLHAAVRRVVPLLALADRGQELLEDRAELVQLGRVPDVWPRAGA